MKVILSVLLTVLCQLPYCRDSPAKHHWDIFYVAQQGAICLLCQIHLAAVKSFKGYTHE